MPRQCSVAISIGDERQRVAVGPREGAAAVAGDAVAAGGVDDVDGHAQVLLEQHGHLARDAIAAAAGGPGADDQDGRFGNASSRAHAGQSERHERGEERARSLRLSNVLRLAVDYQSTTEPSSAS